MHGRRLPVPCSPKLVREGRIPESLVDSLCARGAGREVRAWGCSTIRSATTACKEREEVLLRPGNTSHAARRRGPQVRWCCWRTDKAACCRSPQGSRIALVGTVRRRPAGTCSARGFGLGRGRHGRLDLSRPDCGRVSGPTRVTYARTVANPHKDASQAVFRRGGRPPPRSRPIRCVVAVGHPKAAGERRGGKPCVALRCPAVAAVT